MLQLQLLLQRGLLLLPRPLLLLPVVLLLRLLLFLLWSLLLPLTPPMIPSLLILRGYPRLLLLIFFDYYIFPDGRETVFAFFVALLHAALVGVAQNRSGPARAPAHLCPLRRCPRASSARRVLPLLHPAGVRHGATGSRHARASRWLRCVDDPRLGAQVSRPARGL